jgi:hypothetical protein
VASVTHRSRGRPGFGSGVQLALLVVLAGCGSTQEYPSSVPPRAKVPAGVRPIGSGPQFHPRLRSARVPHCRHALGDRVASHVEIFAADRVVLLAAGIGTEPPRETVAGRISRARCYGRLVTIDPTGLVLARPGNVTLGDLFDDWGQPLGERRVAGFRGAVRVYVDGRRWGGAVRAVPLLRHAEVVVETGPLVPPHRVYTFPHPY